MVASSGVEAAFRLYRGDVFHYLLRRTGDRFQAEDLLQDVFVAAVAGLPELCPEVPVLAWLYVVAARRLTDRRRRERLTLLPLLDDTELGALDPHEAHSVRSALRAALSRLPTSQREVVTLHLLEGYPFAEIAQRLRIQEQAAKKRFQRGLEALRADLAGEFGRAVDVDVTFSTP